jgi:hypothetical protein
MGLASVIIGAGMIGTAAYFIGSAAMITASMCLSGSR